MSGELLLATAVLVAAGAALFGALWLLLPLGRADRCERCSAFVPRGARACEVCGTTWTGPAGERLPSRAELAASWRPAPACGRHDEKAGYLNGGVTRNVVRVATLAMVAGISIRLLGMLGVVALDVQIPPWVDGTLTVVGGLVAFLGFVLLDAA